MAIELELGKRMPARGPASLPTEQGGAYLDPDTIREHLRCLADKGRERDTIRLYAAKLEGFYTYLPPDKRITRRSLAAWRMCWATAVWRLPGSIWQPPARNTPEH